MVKPINVSSVPAQCFSNSNNGQKTIVQTGLSTRAILLQNEGCCSKILSAIKAVVARIINCILCRSSQKQPAPAIVNGQVQPASLDAQIAELEQRHRQSRAQLDALQQVIPVINAREQAAQQRVQVLEGQLVEANNRAEQAQRQLQQAQPGPGLAALQQEIRDANAQRDAARQEGAAAQDRVQVLERQIQAGLNPGAAQQLPDAANQIRELQQRAENAERQVQELNVRMRANQPELANLHIDRPQQPDAQRPPEPDEQPVDAQRPREPNERPVDAEDLPNGAPPDVPDFEPPAGEGQGPRRDPPPLPPRARPGAGAPPPPPPAGADQIPPAGDGQVPPAGEGQVPPVDNRPEVIGDPEAVPAAPDFPVPGQPAAQDAPAEEGADAAQVPPGEAANAGVVQADPQVAAAPAPNVNPLQVLAQRRADVMLGMLNQRRGMENEAIRLQNELAAQEGRDLQAELELHQVVEIVNAEIRAQNQDRPLQDRQPEFNLPALLNPAPLQVGAGGPANIHAAVARRHGVVARLEAVQAPRVEDPLVVAARLAARERRAAQAAQPQPGQNQPPEAPMAAPPLPPGGAAAAPAPRAPNPGANGRQPQGRPALRPIPQPGAQPPAPEPQFPPLNDAQQRARQVAQRLAQGQQQAEDPDAFE